MMEYELIDEPRDEGEDGSAKDRPHASDKDENDSELIRDHSALRHQSSVTPEDYPLKDRAANIPEQDRH